MLTRPNQNPENSPSKNLLKQSVDRNGVIWQHFDGMQPYKSTVSAMQAYAASIRLESLAEAVWLLEHEPIYTGGTSARDTDLLAPGNIPTLLVGRGGPWTFHGPGQRVAYVMLDLSRRGNDVRALVNRLEGWIIASIAEFGIHGQRRTGFPGIWVTVDRLENNAKNSFKSSRMDKIAAIGIRISRWVSWHGISINLDPDLTAFDGIVPCGVTDGGVTSLTKLGASVSMEHLDAALAKNFSNFFQNLSD